MDYIKTKKTYLIKEFLIEMIYLTLGCCIMAIGTSLFLLPNKLSSGGFTGIATILYYLFKPNFFVMVFHMLFFQNIFS